VSDDDLLKGMGKALRERRAEEQAVDHLEVSAPLGDDVRRRIVDRGLRDMRPPRRRAVWTGAVVAVAAAAVWLLWPAASLPGYELQVEGGDVASRSDIAGAGRALSGGSHLEVVVRPSTPVRAPVQAHLFAVTAGHAEEAHRPPEVSSSGVVRWADTPDALFGSLRGDLELVVVVGKRGAAPDRDVVTQPGRHDGWQVLRGRIRVAP
jgi:hypothetical protein